MQMQVLVEEGKIRHVGLSEVGPDQIRAAAAVVPISAIEQEWSLFARDLEVRWYLLMLLLCANNRNICMLCLVLVRDLRWAAICWRC